MASETEVERLVVRLIGDGSSHTKMMLEAIEASKRYEKEIKEATTAEKLRSNELRRGEEVMRSVENATEKYGREAKELNQLLKSGTISQEAYTRAVKKATEEYRQATSQLDKYGKQLKEIGSSIRNFGSGMTFRLTAPIVGLGALAIREFGAFDKAMTVSTSIMDVNEKQAKELRDAVINSVAAGEVTQSATELAEAYFFLASAGKSAEQSMALLPAVAKFATAGNFDMALATDLLTDAQSALGLSTKDVAKDTENLVRVGDALVKGNILANASVQQLSESITNTAGASLKTFNKDVEEGVALLAAYADQGIKGQVAGTSLSRVMLLLSQSSRNAAKEHERLGFAVFDSEGNMRNFADIVQNLEQILGPLSDEMKAATLEQLGFEARIQQAILPLLGTSEAIRRYEKGIRAAGGATEEIANRQMKAFSAQLGILWNQIKIVAIEIGQSLVPVINYLSDQVRGLIKWWRELSDETKLAATYFALVVAAIGPLLIAIGSLTGAIGGLLVALAAVKISIALVGPMFLAAVIAMTKFVAVGALVTYTLITMTKAFMSIHPHIVAFNEAMDETQRRQVVWVERFKAGTEEILAAAQKLGEVDPGGQRMFLNEQLEKARKEVDGYTAGVKTAQDRVKELNTLWNQWTGNKILATAKQELAEMEENAKVAEDRVKALSDALGALKPVEAAIDLKGAEDFSTDVSRALEDQLNQLGKSTKELSLYQLELIGATEGQKAFAAAIADQLAVKQLEVGITELNRSLEEQAATFGMLPFEIEIYKLQLKGATDEQLKLAKAMAAKLKAMTDEKELMEKGAEVTKKYRSEQDKIKEELAEITKLKEAGAISAETYTKALADLEKQFSKDYKADMKVLGVEAVESDSLEAIARLEAYREEMFGRKFGLMEQLGVKGGDGANVAQLPQVSESFYKPEESTLVANETPGQTEVNREKVLEAIKTGIDRLAALAEQQLEKVGITISSANLRG